MKNKLSVYLNVVLVIAVGYLYYLQFSSPKQASHATKIVYMNTDTLAMKYNMLKDIESEFTAEQQQLESLYKEKAQRFQQEVMEFQQKLNAGLLSENQSIKKQQELQSKKEEIEGMDYQLQALVEKTQKKNEEVKKKIVEYLKDHYKDSNYDYIIKYTDAPVGAIWLANDSLDITNEVLEGLNNNYDKDKEKK